MPFTRRFYHINSELFYKSTNSEKNQRICQILTHFVFSMPSINDRIDSKLEVLM